MEDFEKAIENKCFLDLLFFKDVFVDLLEKSKENNMKLANDIKYRISVLERQAQINEYEYLLEMAGSGKIPYPKNEDFNLIEQKYER